MSLFYYYIIEVNIKHQAILKHFPEISDDFGIHRTALFSSKEYNGYQECINEIGENFKEKIEIIQNKECTSKYRIFWEKNSFPHVLEEEDEHEDYNDEDWMPNEAIKMFVHEADDADTWLFRARVFFRENNHVFPTPGMIQ